MTVNVALSQLVCFQLLQTRWPKGLLNVVLSHSFQRRSFERCISAAMATVCVLAHYLHSPPMRVVDLGLDPSASVP